MLQWAMGAHRQKRMIILKTTTNKEQNRKEIGQKLDTIKSYDDLK